MLIIPLNLDSVLLLLHNSKLAYSCFFSKIAIYMRPRAKQPRTFVSKEDYRVSYTTYELTLVFQENFPLFTRK